MVASKDDYLVVVLADLLADKRDLKLAVWWDLKLAAVLVAALVV